MTTQSSSVNYVDRLPPEVLTLIFDAVSFITSSPICKALEPYQRSVLFRTITVRSQSALDRLATAFARTPGLGAQCQTFQVLPRHPRNDDYDGVEARVDVDLRFLLEQLSGTRHVVMRQRTEIRDLLLNEEVATWALRRMSQLNLVNPFHSVRETAALYQVLGLYPALKSLSFSFTPTQKSVAWLASDISTIFPNITSLSLEGSVPLLARLVRSLPNLEVLSVRSNGMAHRATYGTLIQSAPSTLRVLEMMELDKGRVPFLQSRLVDEAFSHFTKLEKLTLSTPCFSSALFRHLRNPLPLRHLTLGSHSLRAIHQDHIKDLISPSSITYNSNLKELVIDVVSGYIGNATAEDDHGLYEVEDILSDWGRPKWQEGRFDYAGMSEILEIAADQGVAVKGTAVAAMDVQRAIWAQEGSEESISDYSSDGDGFGGDSEYGSDD